MLEPTKDWDDAFANGAYVPEAGAILEGLERGSAAYRDSFRIEVDLPYGDAPRERFDLIWPDTTPKGLVVFVHGGYWLRFDKSYWTVLAEGARANGYAVCLPSYVLAPQARLSQITAQIGAAITAAAARVNGPIHIAGHSAGGHLVSRMVSYTSPLQAPVLSRIANTVSISGLHDLRPLMRTKLNETLHIDEAEALTESAALLRPATAAPITCWVGAAERPEFIRQSEILAAMWQGLDANISCVVEPAHNHFTIIEALQDPASPLTQRLLLQDNA